ncbi:MAG: glycosyltransferase, partial [Acidimicrobiales bacterium]
MSRLRVLHLTSSFPRHEADTVAPFLLDLARVEAGAGMDVHVLAPHDAGLPRREDWDGIGIARYRYAPPAWEGLAYRGGLLGAASKPARAPLVPALLAAFLAAATAEARRLRPDVLHAHWWLPAGLAGAGARVATGTPLVVTLHGTDVHLAARPGWRLPARAVAVRATALVAASEALAGEAALVLGLPPGRVGVARMPVSAAAHGIGATPLPPWPPLRLVAVGRLVPEKGLDVLLGAVRRLVAAGQDVRLEVVGGGPE